MGNVYISLTQAISNSIEGGEKLLIRKGTNHPANNHAGQEL